jgi:serine/threonine protein kinase
MEPIMESIMEPYQGTVKEPKPFKKTEQNSLRQQLMQASTLNHEGKKFVPCHRFDEFLTPERIKADLAASGVVPEEQIESLQNFVLGDPGARRAYLILASADLLNYFVEFRDNNFTDDLLPIRFDQIGKLTVGVSIDGNEKKFEFFGEWDENHLALFGDTYQWRFLAPKFGDNIFRYHFQRDQILPFLEKKRLNSGDGTETDGMPHGAGFFGEVFPAKIHKAHLAKKHWPKVSRLHARCMVAALTICDNQTAAGDGIEIAIKKAKDAVELLKYFDQEANNLQEIQSYKSIHLIKPIAAYRYGEDRCLLFPWADGGNLDKLWKDLNDQEPEEGNRANTKWFFEQFCGLSEALKELHAHTAMAEKNCIHGDLKPENILVFNQGTAGILQIADLGLAAFHVEANTNMRGASMIGPGTSRYKPPEMDEHGGQKSRGRAYDVWSMGCILLEQLVWFTSGYEDLKAFQGGTDYFWARPTSGGGYGVHPKVHSYMTFAANNLKSETALRDVVEVIQTNLLVPADERFRAPELHAALQNIMEKCQQGSYAESTTFTLKATESQTNQQDSPRSLMTRFLEVPGGNPNATPLNGPQTNSTTDQGTSGYSFLVPAGPTSSTGSGSSTHNQEVSLPRYEETAKTNFSNSM